MASDAKTGRAAWRTRGTVNDENERGEKRGEKKGEKEISRGIGYVEKAVHGIRLLLPVLL